MTTDYTARLAALLADAVALRDETRDARGKAVPGLAKTKLRRRSQYLDKAVHAINDALVRA